MGHPPLWQQWAESRQWRTEGRAKLLHNHYKAGTPLPEWAKTLDDKDYPDYFELQTAVKKAVASGGASVVQTPSNPVVQETTERSDHQVLLELLLKGRSTQLQFCSHPYWWRSSHSTCSSSTQT